MHISENFPPESIIFTKIFGQEGFPTTSGILKTNSVWQEPENCRQYFYPAGNDSHYIRKYTNNGWSGWKLVSAI